MKKINVSVELYKVCKQLISAIEELNHIDIDQILILVADANNTLRINKIVGCLDLPEGYILDKFPKKKKYLFYFYWPVFFQASAISKLQSLISQLALIPIGCDGTFVDREVDITFDKAKQLLADPKMAILSEKVASLKKRFDIIGDRYELPKFVKK